MKALGMICGVGSMLIGAKKQGWDIVGNIEWREYYHAGTFEKNFPSAFMIHTIKDLTLQQLERCKDLDLIAGHTECGNFSLLHINKGDLMSDKSDIPQFVEAIKKFKPKTFIMDNLPGSLLACNYEYYKNNLPDYDIFFEWISNYNYGNIQKFRKRMFVIGALKELNFFFIPSEFEHNDIIIDKIKDLDNESFNHNIASDDMIMRGYSKYHFDRSFIPKSVEENRMTLREFKDCIRGLESGKCFDYYNKKGEQKHRIGCQKVNVYGYSPVIYGGGAAAFDNYYRSDTLNPFTIRERARIQGAPDDFIFYPVEVKSLKDYQSLIKQTGKFMPVEFCTFLTQYIKDFLEGKIDKNNYTTRRFIKSNELISENRFNYCKNFGYSNQKMVCEYCDMKNCNIKVGN